MQGLQCLNCQNQLRWGYFSAMAGTRPSGSRDRWQSGSSHPLHPSTLTLAPKVNWSCVHGQRCWHCAGDHGSQRHPGAVPPSLQRKRAHPSSALWQVRNSCRMFPMSRHVLNSSCSAAQTEMKLMGLISSDNAHNDQVNLVWMRDPSSVDDIQVVEL